MPRVVSLHPGGVTTVDLGHFAYRIDLGVVPMRDVSCFSLVYRYPPNTTALMRFDGTQIPLSAMMALARVPAPVAESMEALQKVVEVSLDGGSLDADIERMTEAYQLFRNSPRVRVEALDGCVKDSVEVLKAYWALREWMRSGMKEPQEVVVLTTTLVLQP